MDTLFDLPEQLSPRLAWMKRWNIKTDYDQTGLPEFGPWFAFFADEAGTGTATTGDGSTEEDALRNFAALACLPHWNDQPTPAAASPVG